MPPSLATHTHTHTLPWRKTQSDLGTGAKLRPPACSPERAYPVPGQEKAAPGLGPGPVPTQAFSVPRAPRPGH